MLKRPHVLIVDDDEPAARLFARELTPRYEVTIAHDGLTGLELAIANPPDLVVADIRMPVLDGLAMVEKIHQHPATARARVIFLTASDDAAITAPGTRAHLRHVIKKPVPLKVFIQEVERALASHSITPPSFRPRPMV